MPCLAYAVPAAAVFALVGRLSSFRKGIDFIKPAAPAGDEGIMKRKEHGTCRTPPLEPLRWGANGRTADRICCFNRRSAEDPGYWLSTRFLESEDAAAGEITFYDSVTGKPLFVAPRGRSFESFVEESRAHGWPSFRDKEVVAEHVRVLPDSEVVSVDGTHLGHNIPDRKGNRYCINIVSVAGPVPVEGNSDGRQ